MKIKKGDLVRVIQGKDKGAEGVVMRVLPKEDKVIVEGVNVAKKHQKQTRATMQAGIIERDMPIHVSNVALVSQGRATRVGVRTERDGSRVRYAKKTGEALP